MYQPKWSTLPLGQGGEKLEFIRDHEHFEEGRAGERILYKTIEFSQKVEFAEVFLSGFNMSYTRGGDCEVTQIRVDAWVDFGVKNPEFKTPEEIKRLERTVEVKLMYSLKDEDPTGPEDFNCAAIGFTVIAWTRPQ